MKPTVSIIIPCYNCAPTLREAVISCFTQGLTADEFELVMVDDGSTDGTRALMEELSSVHTNIRLLFHETNRGGGAARNTGIQEARGEYIFCLDSDNFFAEDTLKLLLATQRNYACQGVAIEERRFFVGNNSKRFHSHINHITERSITIGDIFSPDHGGTLLDNFLFSKAAYIAAGGYPEHHGFDTQCFELRFLAQHHTVYVARGSVFYHRQSASGGSYFDRVYKAGLFSRNFYLICEDILHLLSYRIRACIMEFDVFSNTKLDLHNLKATLDILYKKSPQEFFAPDYERYLGPDGRARFLTSIDQSTAPADRFSKAVLLLRDGHYQATIDTLQVLLAEGQATKLIYYNLLRAAVGSSPQCSPASIETTTDALLLGLTPQLPTTSLKSRLYTQLRRFF